MNFDRKLHALQAEYLKAEAEVARLQTLINGLNDQLDEIKPQKKTRQVDYRDFDSPAKFNAFIRDKEIELMEDDGEILILFETQESEAECARRRNALIERMNDIRDRSLRIQQEKLEKLTKQLQEYEP